MRDEAPPAPAPAPAPCLPHGQATCLDCHPFASPEFGEGVLSFFHFIFFLADTGSLCEFCRIFGTVVKIEKFSREQNSLLVDDGTAAMTVLISRKMPERKRLGLGAQAEFRGQLCEPLEGMAPGRFLQDARFFLLLRNLVLRVLFT